MYSKIMSGLVLSLVLLVGSPSGAVARYMEDISERRIIGFSPNGDYFAFEEFGKNPGSGNAYANIYVINTIRNKWVKGSPFRVKPSEGLRTRRRVRKRVERMALPLLRRLNIQRNKVRVLATNPITELGKNKRRVRVNPRVTISEVNRPMIFSVDQFTIGTPRHCRTVTRKAIKGLIIRVRREGERQKELHRDKKIPKSRGCPISYTISDVIQLKKSSRRGAVYALIYSIIRQGRYGLERRFIGGGYHDRGDSRDPNYYRDSDEYSDYDTPYYYNQGNPEETSMTSTNGGNDREDEYSTNDYRDDSQDGYKPKDYYKRKQRRR